MPRMENWSICNFLPDEYAAPESGVPVLRGEVHDHERFEDGTYITTSKIVAVSKDKDITTVSGSVYVLGVVDAEYEKMFPGAKDRLKIT